MGPGPGWWLCRKKFKVAVTGWLQRGPRTGWLPPSQGRAGKLEDRGWSPIFFTPGFSSPLLFGLGKEVGSAASVSPSVEWEVLSGLVLWT